VHQPSVARHPTLCLDIQSTVVLQLPHICSIKCLAKSMGWAANTLHAVPCSSPEQPYHFTLCWTSTHLALRNSALLTLAHWPCNCHKRLLQGPATHHKPREGADNTAAELAAQHNLRAPCRGGPPYAASPHQHHKCFKCSVEQQIHNSQDRCTPNRSKQPAWASAKVALRY